MPKRLLHAGFALALLGLALGKAAVHFGWSPAAHELVLAEGDRGEVDADTVLYLDKFEVLRYPSGKIRQYVSTVKTFDRAGKDLASAVISVNHPLRLNGWWIYQYGWGPDQTGTTCTQLRCVKDVGLPVAALGGLLLLVGSLWLAAGRVEKVEGVEGGPRSVAAATECAANRQFLSNADATERVPPSAWRWGLNWLAALLVVSLPLFIIGRAVLRPEPVPALQSPLMAPHVAAYTASYLILLFAAFGIGRRFVPLGFFFMTVGLVLGAVWGKIAWSEWWQFDPKENWSFFTWLAFAAFFHFPPDSRTARWLLRLGAVLIIVTLTWVNFSRMVSGLHSYA